VKSPAHTITVYKARDGWRWKWRSGNGRILAVSSEGYTRRAGAVNAVFSMEEAFVQGNRNLRNFHGPRGK
jgi:uncharacterized protein YegP (UPF0339 family)